MVTVLGANDAPTARNEGFTIGNTGATVLGNVLANDDVDQGDTISLGQIAATSARGAAISIDAQGRAVYDPGDIFAGLGTGATTMDSFSYTVVDSHGAASTATVNQSPLAPLQPLTERIPLFSSPARQIGAPLAEIRCQLAERASGRAG